MKLLVRLIPALAVAFLQPAWAEDADKSVELKVIDLRPQEERDGVGLTELSGKCNKDVYRIADVASDPLKVEASGPIWRSRWVSPATKRRSWC